MNDVNELELISEVQSRPILYDLNSPQTKFDREIAWREVAEVLKCPVENVRRRWRSMRDHFLKEHRIMEGVRLTKSFRKKKRPWFFYQHMEFLIPYCKPLPSKDNGPENESDPEWKFKSLERSLSDNISTIPNRPRRSVPIKLSKRSLDLEGPEEVTLDFSENGAEETMRDENNYSQGCGSATARVDERCFCCGSNSLSSNVKEERTKDPDELFLLSLLPSFKRMSPKKNSEVRIQFQQLLHDVEFGDGY